MRRRAWRTSTGSSGGPSATTTASSAHSAEPLGALPFGYTVERAIIEGRVVSRRAVDATLDSTVQEIFDRMANGASPGSVARWLNAQGIKTQRGTVFAARSVRLIVTNPAYV